MGNIKKDVVNWFKQIYELANESKNKDRRSIKHALEEICSLALMDAQYIEEFVEVIEDK